MVNSVLYYKENLRNTGRYLPFRKAQTPLFIYSYNLGVSSLACHRGGLGRFLGQSLWGLLWRNWYWDTFLSEYVGSLLLMSFHRSSTSIFLLISLSSDTQVGKASGTLKNVMPFRKSGIIRQLKSISLLFFYIVKCCWSFKNFHWRLMNSHKNKFSLWLYCWRCRITFP